MRLTGFLYAREEVAWQLRGDATGHFETRSIGGSLGACVATSLSYIKEIGVADIQAYRQPMLRKVRFRLHLRHAARVHVADHHLRAQGRRRERHHQRSWTAPR